MSDSHTTTTGLSTSDWRELALRDADGLEVSLLWSRSADRVKVTVADLRLDMRFELDVAGADALAAFHHPFAYAPSPSFDSLESAHDTPTLHQQV